MYSQLETQLNRAAVAILLASAKQRSTVRDLTSSTSSTWLLINLPSPRSFDHSFFHVARYPLWVFQAMVIRTELLIDPSTRLTPPGSSESRSAAYRSTGSSLGGEVRNGTLNRDPEALETHLSIATRWWFPVIWWKKPQVTQVVAKWRSLEEPWK